MQLRSWDPDANEQRVAPSCACSRSEQKPSWVSTPCDDALSTPGPVLHTCFLRVHVLHIFHKFRVKPGKSAATRTLEPSLHSRHQTGSEGLWEADVKITDKTMSDTQRIWAHDALIVSFRSMWRKRRRDGRLLPGWRWWRLDSLQRKLNRSR